MLSWNHDETRGCYGNRICQIMFTHVVCIRSIISHHMRPCIEHSNWNPWSVIHWPYLDAPNVLGPDSIKRCHLTSIGNPIVEIRRSYDRLISTMEFPIPVRRHLYIESGPWTKMIGWIQCAARYTSLWGYHKAKHNTLQWCYDDCYGLSDNRHFDCLINCLFRRISKKIPKLRVSGFCDGNLTVTDGFPHKEPVTRKIFPFDDVIIKT